MISTKDRKGRKRKSEKIKGKKRENKDRKGKESLRDMGWEWGGKYLGGL